MNTLLYLMISNTIISNMVLTEYDWESQNSKEKEFWQIFDDDLLSIIFWVVVISIMGVLMLLITLCLFCLCIPTKKSSNKRKKRSPGPLIEMGVTDNNLNRAGIAPAILKESGDNDEQKSSIKTNRSSDETMSQKSSPQSGESGRRSANSLTDPNITRLLYVAQESDETIVKEKARSASPRSPQKLISPKTQSPPTTVSTDKPPDKTKSTQTAVEGKSPTTDKPTDSAQKMSQELDQSKSKPRGKTSAYNKRIKDFKKELNNKQKKPKESKKRKRKEEDKQKTIE